MNNAALFEPDINSLPLSHRGKVRNSYDAGNGRLLVIASDRLSAFDVVLDDPIPGKGHVLTAMSDFWFGFLKDVIPNHCVNLPPEVVVLLNEYDQVMGRAMLVRRFQPLKIEAIVRGYIIGSGWKDYQKTGMISDIPLPTGLRQAEKLPQPIFTPSTKAPDGEHDVNISFADAERIVGPYVADLVRNKSIELYTKAAEYAGTRGIIIADTKFEFGTDAAGKVYLIDEILTPDSSRFWPADQYQVGMSPISFDKQFVRDWLEQQPWDKKAPAPRLPAEIITQTAAKYREALRLLTGQELDD